MEGQQQTQQRGRQFPRIRAIIALLVSLLVSAGAILLILSTERAIAAYWLVIIPIALAAIGQLIPLYQYLFPISPDTSHDLSPMPPAPVEVKVTLTPSVTDPIRDDQTRLSAAPTHLWNVPYRRNPYFTGRENLLKQLHDNLTTAKTAALTQAQAISGLGGIGKTQAAVEYAYRYGHEYHPVLWINADIKETLNSDIVGLARLLHLLEKDEQDLASVINSVKKWLVNHNTLSLHFLVEPPQAAKSSYKVSGWTPDWNCS